MPKIIKNQAYELLEEAFFPEKEAIYYVEAGEHEMVVLPSLISQEKQAAILEEQLALKGKEGYDWFILEDWVWENQHFFLLWLLPEDFRRGLNRLKVNLPAQIYDRRFLLAKRALLSKGEGEEALFLCFFAEEAYYHLIACEGKIIDLQRYQERPSVEKQSEFCYDFYHRYHIDLFLEEPLVEVENLEKHSADFQLGAPHILEKKGRVSFLRTLKPSYVLLFLGMIMLPLLFYGGQALKPPVEVEEKQEQTSPQKKEVAEVMGYLEEHLGTKDWFLELGQGYGEVEIFFKEFKEVGPFLKKMEKAFPDIKIKELDQQDEDGYFVVTRFSL